MAIFNSYVNLPEGNIYSILLQYIIFYHTNIYQPCICKYVSRAEFPTKKDLVIPTVAHSFLDLASQKTAWLQICTELYISWYYDIILY